MIEHCVNKFPTWLSDWCLSPPFSFLSQKTRCTCPSSLLLPTVGCPGHCGTVFLQDSGTMSDKHITQEVRNMSLRIALGSRFGLFFFPQHVPVSCSFPYPPRLRRTLLVYLRQAAWDFATCHNHVKFLFTAGSLVGTTCVAGLRMPSSAVLLGPNFLSLVVLFGHCEAE